MASVKSTQPKASFLRFPLVLFGLITMSLGLWGGLARIGWTPVQTNHANLLTLHGPLMVLGFLGTVVSLERAVALKRNWGYLAPSALLVGTLITLFGGPQLLGQVLQLIGALFLVGLLSLVVKIQPNIANATLVLASIFLSFGVLLWITHRAIPQIILWWAGFLIMTILGERLELSAMGRLSRRGIQIFCAITVALTIGLMLSAFGIQELGTRIFGAACISFALWLSHYDVARFTIRRRGLPRFVAWALLPGYAWLLVGGVLWLIFGVTSAGAIYDSQLHSIFIGFIFSMIFGHAPVIFPGVLGIRIPYRPWFYIHLILLHVGLVIRVIGNASEKHAVSELGAATSATAILLFLIATISSAVIAHTKSKPKKATI